MVSILIPLLGLLLFGSCVARADLDLTPTQGVHVLEQRKIKNIVFHDGPAEITYQAPKGWTCTGSHNFAALSIPEHPQASAFIQNAARPRIPALDDKAAGLFKENPALLGLPKGAKNINITGVTIDPLIIDSHHTLEVQLTYSFFGQTCARSLLLLVRNGAEVSFVLDCLAPDFKMLHTAFRGSLFSIENL